MVVDDELRDQFWQRLQMAVEDCQQMIELLEKIDDGSNRYIGEWEELDNAFFHINNVRRWLWRAWVGVATQEPPAEVPVPHPRFHLP